MKLEFYEQKLLFLVWMTKETSKIWEHEKFVAFESVLKIPHSHEVLFGSRRQGLCIFKMKDRQPKIIFYLEDEDISREWWEL